MTKVLVVDNDEGARNNIKEALKLDHDDWFIETASDEDAAIQLIVSGLESSKPFALVITDLAMAKDQSGMTLLKVARRLDPTVMAILYTGREDLLDRSAALETGAFDVVERNLRGGASLSEIRMKARFAVQSWQWQREVGILSRYFDGRIVEKIRRDSTVLEMRERLVTIVFWDVRGFTRLCDILKAQPTLITGFLKDYCEHSARVIFDHEGVLDKFIGDGVMSLFGVLSDRADNGDADAVAAVRAALKFRVVFEELLKHWLVAWNREVPDKIEIGLGVGIHTCRALVGNIGTPFREQFTALGDGVNIASRIEGTAKPGQVLLSQPTNMRVSRLIQTTLTGEIVKMKNRSGEFELFAAEREKPFSELSGSR